MTIGSSSIANATGDRSSYTITVEVADTSGTPLEARVRIEGSNGLVYPLIPDSVALSFYGSGGFCYAFNTVTTSVPQGTTRVTVGRGFEWKPVDSLIYVDRDTTLQIALTRIFDLRPLGWYSGDLHAHTQHEPINYNISPEQAKAITRAEGLSIVHFLDRWHEWTGGPHVLSDEETILYFSFEYRNQTYGHVYFPALTTPLPDGCCLDPAPAFPMLLDLYDNVLPGHGRGMVLAHPHSTDNYYYDDEWPGAGLGRELPVLAALGSLDGMDVLSYGNFPDEDWEEWYDLLSCGIGINPSVGSDAMLDRISSSPLGGWRIYANLGEGVPLDYYDWVDALFAGRSFLTNYPLITEFSVNGYQPGETMPADGEVLSATVHMHALCALGTHRIGLVAEGQEVWSTEFGLNGLSITEIDTTFAIEIPTPSWIAGTFQAPGGNAHAAVGTPFAHTNVIRILQGGEPIRRTPPAAEWLQYLDRLEILVEGRGSWSLPWHRDSVLTRIDRARDVFSRAFVQPPSSFALLTPGLGDTLRLDDLYFEWEPATDEEEGDEITYVLTIASDSMLAVDPQVYELDHEWMSGVELDPTQWYWWRVEAVDQGGNSSPSIPAKSSVYVDYPASGIEDRPDDQVLIARAIPNPSGGRVVLAGLAEPIAIFDLTGRRVASIGRGVTRAEGNWSWDGLIHGRPAPAGLYWARSLSTGSTVRWIQIR